MVILQQTSRTGYNASRIDRTPHVFTTRAVAIASLELSFRAVPHTTTHAPDGAIHITAFHGKLPKDGPAYNSTSTYSLQDLRVIEQPEHL